MTSGVEWVAVDWGTSNLRAWGMGADGHPVLERSSPNGMGKLQRHEFPGALTALLDGIAAGSGMPVLICGMAGARQGWLEAPYLEAPADLRGLVHSAGRPEMQDTRIAPAILPGVCQKSGGDDVMRGEETQLLGLSVLRPGFDGMVCMPGTHSKWAQLNGTRLEHFSTAITGELYDVLRTQSVLRHSLTGSLDGPGRLDGFLAGAEAGLESPDQLLGQLFQVRAAALLSGRQPDWCAGFLSGLLIGSEVAGHRGRIGKQVVPLIGSSTLCELYASVLDMAGIESEIHDATAVVIAGLAAARRLGGEE